MAGGTSNSRDETIVAIATPQGRGGVGIVRISGPLAGEIGRGISRKDLEPRLASFSSFLNTHDEIIDEGIILFFKGPASFTGEDVVEFHAHGSPVVLEQILDTALKLGARIASPGEFTERAFLNGKIDLLQAEAVADLIESTSVQAARSASRSLQGKFSLEINQIVSLLVELRAYIEGALDFPEEEIDFLAGPEVGTKLDQIINSTTLILNKAKQGLRLREGLRLVIAGRPNVGKSSLMNLLLGVDAAIVTDIPGTTRDIIVNDIVLHGMPVTLMDTAGIREAEDIVELEGIKRTRSAIDQADLVLLIMDIEDEAGIRNQEERLHEVLQDKQHIIVWNKIDKKDLKPHMVEDNEQIQIYLSAKTGQGIDLLLKGIGSIVGAQEMADDIYLARQRHLEALTCALQYLQAGKEQLQEQHAGELLADDLRVAHEALMQITGEFMPDDLLGEIFARFCIGK